MRLAFIWQLLVVFLVIIFNHISGFAQERLSIDNILSMYRQTQEALILSKYKAISDNRYLLFKKSFLPEISLNLSLSNYNRYINEIIQPDGSFAFREQNSATSSVNLSIEQKIPFLGGKVTVTNSLRRLDLFGNTDNSVSYSASWVGLSYTQSLNFFNAYKWDIEAQNANQAHVELNYSNPFQEIKNRAVEFYLNFIVDVDETTDLSLGNPVRVVDLSDGSIRYLSDNNKPSIILKDTEITIDPRTIGERDWKSALMMRGLWYSLILHPDRGDQAWLNLVKMSFQSKVMTPYTSYLVVENEAQKAILKRKQNQVLSSNKEFTLGDSVESMSEPHLYIFAFLVLLTFGYLKRQYMF